MALSWIPSLLVHCLNNLIAVFYFKLQSKKFLFSIINSFHKGFFYKSFVVYVAHYESFEVCNFNVLFVSALAEPIK